MLRKNVYS